MKILQKKRILVLVALFVLMALASTVVAQSLEDRLHMYDQQVYAQFTSHYPRDSRYD